MGKLKLGVLGSGRGSNFVAIAEAISRGQLDAEICLVASDLGEAKILEEAKKRGLKTFVCRKGQFKTKLEPDIETELVDALQTAGAELIILAGYMRVVKAPLLCAFPGRIVNIHPSLLPDFPGLRAWEQAVAAGATKTGCTVHWVNEVIDGGAVIAQREVKILPKDDADSVHQKIQKEEHILYPSVLQRIQSGEIEIS